MFAKVDFPGQESSQYLDGMLRSTVAATAGYHTLLGSPEIRPVTVEIPAGSGYLLSSKRNGTWLGMVDAEYLERAIFQQIPHEEGRLVIAVMCSPAIGTPMSLSRTVPTIGRAGATT